MSNSQESIFEEHLGIRELPTGWKIALMGDIAKIVGGGTPKASDDSNFSEDGYPWITPADLSGFNGTYIERGRRSLSEKGLKSCSAMIMPKGAVLMSSRAPIGYVAIASNSVCTNQGFKSFICPSGILPEYVLYWLRFIRPLLEKMGSGTTFLEISGARASQIPILVPPAAEQKRIVAKIEELLPKVNAVRERLSRVKEIMKRFRQSVLSAACSGRLTEEWRERVRIDEPAHELLKKILSAKPVVQKSEMRLRGGKSKQHSSKETYTEFEGDARESWVLASIDMLTSLVTSGSRAWKKFYSEEGPGTFIMGQNVKPFRLEFTRKIRVNPPDDDGSIS
jgi:type I restriction enzyme, S subunit